MNGAPGARGATAAQGPPRRALVVALLLALTLVLAAGGALVAVPRAAAEEHDTLAVEVTGVAPAYLAPGQALTVTGTLTNRTDGELTGAGVSLVVQRNAPNSRFALDAWLDPANRYATLLLARQALPTSLPPGASTGFSLTVPAEDVPLQATAPSWGPRGLRVDAAADGAAGRMTAADRTLLVWLPGVTAAPTRVSALIPLVATPADLLGSALADVGVDAQSEQRVLALAQATAGRPAVAWALDPALLAGPTPAGAPGPTPPPPTGSPPAAPPPAATPAPDGEGEAGTALVAALRAIGGGREVVALPYADADAAALTHRGQTRLYEVASDAGDELVAAAGLRPLDAVAWPAGAEPDAATVRTLAAQGARAVVLPLESLSAPGSRTYTPTGRGTVRTDPDDTGSGVAALLAEDALSGALAGRVPRRAEADGPAAALAARQYLLALTAMISRERPADVQHLLAVVPRDFEGDAAALGDRLAVLEAAPWVELAPLSALVGAADPGLTETTLPDEVVAEAEIGHDLLDEVVQARTALADFATIASEPEHLVREEQRRLLQVTSAGWRADPGGRSSFANVVLKAASDLPSRVGVLTSGTVNLISETGGLPVTVRNGLDQAITVHLRLTPRGPSIRLPEVVPVEVPAGSEIAVPVAVSAVGSADVEVDVELLDSAGRPVGDPATLFVRVRADWENVGTAVVAAAVAVTFVLGLVRSIRRAHRRRAVPEGRVA